MTVDRREFLLLAAVNAFASGSVVASIQTTPASSIKAIVFDAFAIFDPRPVAALAESYFPGTAAEFMSAWRARQFEYQWLRALSGRYVDFLQVTEESLRFTARQLQIDLSLNQTQQLMARWSNLQVWPDAYEGVMSLHKAGFRLAFLSNMTGAVLANGLARAKLNKAFEAILSTERIRSYKPDARAYKMAATNLNLPREEMLFVPFAGWDVAGAKWFGYPTFWINRLGARAEELGAAADGSGEDFNSLLRFVLRPTRSAPA